MSRKTHHFVTSEPHNQVADMAKNQDESQLDGSNTSNNKPNATDKIDSSAFQNWLNKSYENVISTNQNSTDIEMATTSSTPIVAKKKSLHSMSLEKEVEKLLTIWPPLSTYGQPHPVEGRYNIIRSKRKILSIVEMSTPDILLCCQGRWPSHTS